MLSGNYVFSERRHFLNLQEIINGKPNRYIDEDIFFNEAPQTKTYEFTGDCFLLVDRKSYSAASTFASTFQCYDMGYIIGEPTGGTKVFRANAYNKTLPKSGFIFFVSTTKLWTPCYDQENQSVIPNIEVVPSINERVHKVDSQLNMAHLLINKIQRKKASMSK